MENQTNTSETYSSCLPKRLSKYAVEQNSAQYSEEDHLVWRFKLTHLERYLKSRAHESYSEGLQKTGITINKIPSISSIDNHLKEFSWRAVPVSGFLPPAAFMEFQALGYLPIASDMRTLQNILYTPAPDIVHEAAGHAPLLFNKEYSQYLKNYAEVANKALLSQEDVDLYEAIRELSDLKEIPNVDEKLVLAAQQRLDECSANVTFISEVQYLGRMNWWTAEYGLIGDLDNPKIFGAGLLSSLGESTQCLYQPKKIKLSYDCIYFKYDITEQQPHLFVAKDFNDLNRVLEDLTLDMSYKQGGKKSLEKAYMSKAVCTVKVSGGESYSGLVSEYGEGHFTLLGPVQTIQNGQVIVHDSSMRISISSYNDIESIHGGPLSRELSGYEGDFEVKYVPEKKLSQHQLTKEEIYKCLLKFENGDLSDSDFKVLGERVHEFHQKDWLVQYYYNLFQVNLGMKSGDSAYSDLCQNSDIVKTLGPIVEPKVKEYFKSL